MWWSLRFKKFINFKIMENLVIFWMVGLIIIYCFSFLKKLSLKWTTISHLPVSLAYLIIFYFFNIKGLKQNIEGMGNPDWIFELIRFWESIEFEFIVFIVISLAGYLITLFIVFKRFDKKWLFVVLIEMLSLFWLSLFVYGLISDGFFG